MIFMDFGWILGSALKIEDQKLYHFSDPSKKFTTLFLRFHSAYRYLKFTLYRTKVGLVVFKFFSLHFQSGQSSRKSEKIVSRVHIFENLPNFWHFRCSLPPPPLPCTPGWIRHPQSRKIHFNSRKHLFRCLLNT